MFRFLFLSKKYSKGFTLIELLIVGVVISVLSAITLSVINVQRQRQYARDAIIVSNLKKVAEVIESYRVLEGEYPDCINGNQIGDPTTCDTVLDSMIPNWPAGVNYVYDNGNFGVYAESNKDPVINYKYSNAWNNQFQGIAIQECHDQDISTPDTCVQ